MRLGGQVSDKVRAPGVQHAAAVAPRLDEAPGLKVFPRLVAGPVMSLICFRVSLR